MSNAWKLVTYITSAVVGVVLSFSVHAGASLDNSVGVALGQECVRPKEEGAEKNDYMRKYHMQELFKKRDLTTHQGIRTKDFSIKECVDCHVNVDPAGKPIPVNAQGQFCAGCHQYAAVSLDCFQCHATVPAKNSQRLQNYLTKHPVKK